MEKMRTHFTSIRSGTGDKKTWVYSWGFVPPTYGVVTDDAPCGIGSAPSSVRRTWSVCWCGAAEWLLGREGDRECSLEQALKRDDMVYSWYFPEHFGLFFLLSACARKAFLLRETELVRSVVYCSFAESTASRFHWPHCSHRALLLPSSLWYVEQVNNSWRLHTDWMHSHLS